MDLLDLMTWKMRLFRFYLINRYRPRTLGEANMSILDKLSVPVDGENAGTLMPKLGYRFRVSFINMGTENTNIATNNVVSVTRPSLNHEEVVIDTYNSKIYAAGKHYWDSVTITFRDDITSATSALIDQQMARQIDMASQSSPQAGVSYKFQIVIENLNGANPNPEVLDTWILDGCYISQLQYGESNYSSGTEYQTITMQVRFDNAQHVVGSVDNLSNPQYNTDPNTQTNATQ